MSQPAQPDEARELRLVDNVEMKIALANDNKLQPLLNLYLPPLILKLGSPHAAVREKVIAVCQHVNQRVKAPDFQLPVAALLQQFKDPSAGGSSPLIRNFDLMYITQGIERIKDTKERAGLLPIIVRDISKHDNEHHQRSLFNILIRLLPQFKAPPRGTAEDTALRESFGFAEKPEDAVWLSQWFSNLMLLSMWIFPIVSDGPPRSLPALARQMLQGPPSKEQKQCPGLSKLDVEFLTLGQKEHSFEPASLLGELKVAALQFLASGAFTDQERYFPSLIASTDSTSSVVDLGKDIFKRCSATVSKEDEEVVNTLYMLLLGSSGVLSVKETLQTDIVVILSKSREAIAPARSYALRKVVSLGLKSTYPKLRRAAFEFVTWMSRMGSNDLMTEIGPRTIKKLKFWLLSDATQLDPSHSRSGDGMGDHIRAFGYETLALVAARCINVVLEPELGLIRFFFRQLRNEKGSVTHGIETAMSTLLAGVVKESLSLDVHAALEELLLELVVEEQRSLGQAVKWAGRILGFGSPVGRWIAVLAIGIGGPAAEEGAKALHPYYYRLNNPAPPPLVKDSRDDSAMDLDAPSYDRYAFPKFDAVVQYFFNKAEDGPRSGLPESFSRQGFVNSELPTTPFTAALSFCKRVAYWEALQTPQKAAGLAASADSSTPDDNAFDIKIDEDWERNVDISLTTDENARATISFFLRSGLSGAAGEARQNAVQVLFKQAWTAMMYNNEGIDDVRGAWNDLAVLVSEEYADPKYTDKLNVLKKQAFNPKEDTRRTASFAIGLLASQQSFVDSPAFSTLVSDIVQSTTEKKHGGFLTLGALLTRLQQRGRIDKVDKAEVDKGIKSVVDVLRSRDSMLIEAAIQVLGELAIFGVLTKDNIPEDVVKIVTDRAKKDEKTLLTLAYLAFLYPEDSKEANQLVDEIINLGEKGGVDSAFVAGEALASAAAGWGCSAIRRNRTIAGVAWIGGQRKAVGTMLDELLTKANEPGGGGKRRMTCVGMLSIIEFCGDDASVQSRLSPAQKAFRSFLTDRDEFIQESAARGLTACYGLSDEETRQSLVSSLVSSFTGETREQLRVNRDTQLFEPGQLPTGEGQSVGSYGDIMSLAAEVGDPSLVYKFMSLARHNSVWSSRAAFGRFGLGSLLKSSDEVKENAKLWPVLFRYRFDPNPTVRRSMEDIWSALGGNAETMDRWWKNIIEECLKSAFNGEWRVREASIGALADIVSGRKVSQYKEYLERIWKVAFTLMDDIKESVRVAALKLSKELSQGIVRAVEGESGQTEKQEILQSLMEFLMSQQGLYSRAKETKTFALHTLLKVVKSGGAILRPWVPELVEKLLMLLSDIEPDVVNYLHLNADKYNTTGEDIDRIRLNQIRSSPIMSNIEELLDTLDDKSMKLFIPGLHRAIKTSIGLPSKAGSSRVVVSLSMRKPALFRPYADEVLKTVLAAVKDRSEVIAGAFAGSAGYLCRLASDDGILKVVSWARDRYFEGEDAVERKISGELVAAIYKHAPDRANALAVDILPFVFIARNDMEKTVNAEFSKTWTENTGGSGAVKLYLNEIVDLSSKHLGSARWVVKQTASLALASAATSIGTDINSEQLKKLWPAFVTATGGKSWDGKEKVLSALVLAAKKARKTSELEPAAVSELEKIVVREARRNNVAYRSAALKSLGDFVEAFPEQKLFETVRETVERALGDDDEDKMDLDDAPGKSQDKVKTTTLVNAMNAVAQAIPEGSENLSEITSTLSLFEKHVTPAAMTAHTVKMKRIQSYKLILAKSSSTVSTEILDKLWAGILEHARDRGHENGRIEAAKAMEKWLEVAKGRGLLDEKVQTKVKGDVEDVVKNESSPLVVEALKGVREVVGI